MTLPAIQDHAPWIVLALVAVVFASFLRERFRPDVVAMSAAALLLALGILETAEMTAVFGNGGPVAVAAMFVLSAALERTGCIDVIGGIVKRAAARSHLRAVVALLAAALVLSAFINNTPVVVVLTPVAIMLGREMGVAPSRLLIPLSFASIFGGTTTLIGTSTNLLVSGRAAAAGLAPVGMFEITAAGAILGLVGMTYLAVAGRWLLPDRRTLADMLGSRGGRSFLAELVVPAGSPFVGKRADATGLNAARGLDVVDVLREERSHRYALDATILRAGDRLVVRTNAGDVMGLRESGDLTAVGDPAPSETVEARQTTVMEGIVGPRSRLAGYRIGELNFRRLYGVYILAVHRRGADLSAGFQDVRLEFGDTLLLEGPPEGLRRLFDRRVLVNLTQPGERPLRRSKAPIALGAVFAVMAVSALELLPIEAAALIAAVFVVAAGCLTADEAYASIHWNILFLIFGMLGVGLAMEKSGAVAIIVAAALPYLGLLGPLAVLAGIYLLTSLLTEMVSNNAAAILLTPIAIAVAQQLGADPRPFVMAVLFAASASFATPIGYQTNTFVYSAGGYRFTDFLKIGVPLNLLLWATAVAVIPIFWPL
ncbi:MAG: SLC13 family permease [Alphaproteobacteria bacterium]